MKAGLAESIDFLFMVMWVIIIEQYQREELMTRIGLYLLILFFLASCSSVTKTLKYGYLPGSDYQYYSPVKPVDLKGKKFNLIVADARNKNMISCFGVSIPRDTELEGKTGYDFFSKYFQAMIEANNGIIDPLAQEIIHVQLTGLSGDLKGFVSGHVAGFVEFNIVASEYKKSFCSTMYDGDKDAPLGKYSVDTRKGAFRKIVSASARKAIEEFLNDFAHVQGSAL